MTSGAGTPDGGRYTFDGRIATGGMGEVWRATDQVLGRQVAVKVLKPEYSDDPTFRSRFETEARNAAALHHANVAAVFDFGELSSAGAGEVPRPYLVMELVRGEPLSALLRGGEPMPAETASDLMAQAADGLAAAHDLGIVHRDVKPANLMVTPDRRVKITDFGIARAADAVALTQTGQVIGTPQYLSPEQAEGKQATTASDIYSLGVVLYECLAGRRPFDADSPIATALAHLRQPVPPLPDDVPERLQSIVAIALTKDPRARFASVREMAGALRGGPLPAGHAGAVGPDTRPDTLPDDDPADAPTRVAGPAAAGAVAGAGLGAAAGRRPGQDARDAAWDSDHRFAGSGEPPRTLAPTPSNGPPSGSDHDRPGWVPWVGAALALLVAALVVYLLVSQLGGDDEGTGTGSSPSARPSPSRSTPSRTPSRTPSPSSSPTPTTVSVASADYVGRSEDDARGDLEDLGLRVRSQPVDNPDGKPEGTVAAVNPSGRVPKGGTVTLSVYRAKPTPSPTPTATPTASPTATPSSPGEEDEQP